MSKYTITMKKCLFNFLKKFNDHKSLLFKQMNFYRQSYEKYANRIILQNLV